MIEILIVVIGILVIANLFFTIKRKVKTENNTTLGEIAELRDFLMKLDVMLSVVDKSLKDEFQRNRSESNQNSKINRDELAKNLGSFKNEFSENIKNFKNEFSGGLTLFKNEFSENIKSFNEMLRAKFSDLEVLQDKLNKMNLEHIKEVQITIEKNLTEIREDNNKQLEEMRRTVDEKLQKTLNERLNQSFETVRKQLQSVQEGLGEMKSLASEVGGLKKVLGNVKLRGVLGEIQLSMLLEQILAPEQYETNVKTKKGSSESVEFAIKLPGKDDSEQVWLPIDAKFPKDVYEHLLEAYDTTDPKTITQAQKNLQTTIQNMAKDISNKYIDPPNTTDFGVMFLPFEGIYAEVVRNANLIEDLQKKYKIIVAGPTTLAAMLNSLQMGFRTLALQKRSSEVWQVLGAVKTEFDKFEGILEKAHKNIKSGLNHLDTAMGTRSRAIRRKLKNVETLSENNENNIIEDK